MPLLSSVASATAGTLFTGAATFLDLHAGGYHHQSNEDLSTVSGCSGGADLILSASPSSLDRSNAMKTTRDANCHYEKKHQSSLLPPKATAAFERCYGNADISDMIGRTFSFLLLARFTVSLLLATVLGEE